MRLLDLEPQFVRFLRKSEPFWIDAEGVRSLYERPDCRVEMQDQEYRVNVDTLAEAHGLHFLNPAEFMKNAGCVGSSCIEIFFFGTEVPPDVGVNREGRPVRWTVVSGTGYDDLTLTPSILVDDPDGWHGWIRNGEVVDA